MPLLRYLTPLLIIGRGVIFQRFYILVYSFVVVIWICRELQDEINQDYIQNQCQQEDRPEPPVVDECSGNEVIRPDIRIILGFLGWLGIAEHG